MKETFYFTHDYNARSDEKIKKLIRVHWMLWYWIFWSIIEDLYQNANALRTDYDSIAYDMRVNENIIKSIINDFDLFIIEWDIFGSKSVETRLLERDAKSSKARESARKRWEKKDANALRTDSECNAIKEKKEKKKKEKEKENKEIDTTLIFQDHIKTDTDSITSLAIKYFLLLWWKPAKDETVDTFRNWIKETFEANWIKDPNKMKYPLDTWYWYWKDQKKSKNLKNTFATTIKFSLPKN